mmetsp:Transcript_33738/g.84947  ORF Transcript_33738/g.84947 Transcript_33738/m.84947 type:complete len:259 (-) Transcript_33738:593-1369(-)
MRARAPPAALSSASSAASSPLRRAVSLIAARSATARSSGGLSPLPGPPPRWSSAARRHSAKMCNAGRASSRACSAMDAMSSKSTRLTPGCCPPGLACFTTGSTRMPTGMLGWASSATLSSAVMKSRTASLRMCSMSMKTMVLYTTGEKALAAAMKACRSWNKQARAWICDDGCGSRAARFNTLTASLQSSPRTSTSSGKADHKVVSSVRDASRRSAGPSAHRRDSSSIAEGVCSAARTRRGPGPRARSAGTSTLSASM